MYNSCLYNRVRFNSLCVEDISPTPDTGGGGIPDRVRQRKRKVRIEQFFFLIGKKLFFHTQFFNIIGFILLAKKHNITLNAEALIHLQKDLVLNGKKALPFIAKKDIKAFSKFLKAEQIDITSVKLFLSNQNYEIAGVKLSNEVFYKALKGESIVYKEHNQEIYGERNIDEILELLDLLDLEE